MASALSMPFFSDAAFSSHYYWRAVNERQEVALLVKTSNEAASNGWRFWKPCKPTANTIRKFGGYYSNHVLLSRELDFSLNSCYTGIPLSVDTVISGYWTGPNDEDGCGYVQALVQRII